MNQARPEDDESASPDRPRLVVGLTGGVGSGKSTVAGFFRELGVPIIDADCLARELTLPGQPALREISEAFGTEVLDAQGCLDRAALRRIVFADESARRRLEAILHPRIRERMEAALMEVAEAPYVILVIPLLLESRQQDLVDRILVVDADPALQVRRVTVRDGVDEAQVRAIMAAQVDRETRLAAADDLILNEDDLEELKRQVQALHQRYLKLAGWEGEVVPAGREVPPAPETEAREREDVPESTARKASAPLDLTHEDDWVVYELPLNERMRLLLRLEALFQAGTHFCAGHDPWDSRAAVNVLLDLMEVCSRLDVRKELLQELDRMHLALRRYIGRPGVDDRSLEATLGRLQTQAKALREKDVCGQDLREKELLLMVRQRLGVAGAACSFDVPAYFHWSQRPAERRRADLEAWFATFDPLRRAVAQVLGLLRDSAVARPVTAEGGFYQEALSGEHHFQLVRIWVPAALPYYVEPSGARQRYSVRFRRFDVDSGKGAQAEEDVVFKVSRCAL